MLIVNDKIRYFLYRGLYRFHYTESKINHFFFFVLFSSIYFTLLQYWYNKIRKKGRKKIIRASTFFFLQYFISTQLIENKIRFVHQYSDVNICVVFPNDFLFFFLCLFNFMHIRHFKKIVFICQQIKVNGVVINKR